MKYLIEINEINGRFEVVYFENEVKKMNFENQEAALSFIADFDFSQSYK